MSVSSAFFNLRQFLSLSLNFMTLTFFKNSGISLNVSWFEFVWCFLMIKFRLYILAAIPQKWCAFLSVLHLDVHDGYTVPARFLHSKITIINEYLVGRYQVFHHTFTDFCIHWWFFILFFKLIFKILWYTVYEFLTIVHNWRLPLLV